MIRYDILLVKYYIEYPQIIIASPGERNQISADLECEWEGGWGRWREVDGGWGRLRENEGGWGRLMAMEGGGGWGGDFIGS